MKTIIKACMLIPSLPIWLALNNSVVLAETNLYSTNDYESSVNLQIKSVKHDEIKKNIAQDKLKLKLKLYLNRDNNKNKVNQRLTNRLSYNHLKNKQYIKHIYKSIDNFSTIDNLSGRNSKIPVNKSLGVIPSIARLDENPKFKLSEETKINSNYLISPKEADSDEIHPLTTTLPLNNVPISHLTEWEFYNGSNFGDDISTDISGGAILKINGQITESLTTDNVYTVDQKGSYLQLQTVRESRQVTITNNEPQSLLGMHMQMSLTATCLANDNPEGKKCTYTPGLITDRNSIDPDFLVPTRIIQTANMGEVMTAESLKYMEIPGFQMGANGQKVGIDLYFPNAGALPGNSQGNKTFYQRKEEIQNTQLSLYSRIRQIVKTNHNKAVIGRTVRGFGLIADKENLLINSAAQLGNFFLPDVNPRLSGGVKKVNTNINKNLFAAANNVRLPSSSFTFYHAGIGSADSLKPGIKHKSQIPKAKFNSIWIGISPIVERRIHKITRYQPVSEQRILSEGGGEGGIDSNVSLLSLANNERFSTSELQDFYAQVYLTNYIQDVNYVNGTQYVEDIKYYPHISLTANVQGSLDSFKYYGGLITGKIIKAYAGADYTRNFGSLTIATGAIGYINPDRDYFSQIFGSISKGIQLGKKTNLLLSGRFNYALDRENRIGKIESEAPASFFQLGAKANFANVYVALTSYIDNVLPKSIDSTLMANIGINFNKNFRLSAYYTPINKTSSRSRYGATAKLRLGSKYNSPTISVSWSNMDYDLGKDANSKQITFNNNRFKVLFRFGRPGNSFNKIDKNKRLQRKRKKLIDILKRTKTI